MKIRQSNSVLTCYVEFDCYRLTVTLRCNSFGLVDDWHRELRLLITNKEREKKRQKKTNKYIVWNWNWLISLWFFWYWICYIGKWYAFLNYTTLYNNRFSRYRVFHLFAKELLISSGTYVWRIDEFCFLGV